MLADCGAIAKDAKCSSDFVLESFARHSVIYASATYFLILRRLNEVIYSSGWYRNNPEKLPHDLVNSKTFQMPKSLSPVVHA